MVVAFSFSFPLPFFFPAIVLSLVRLRVFMIWCFYLETDILPILDHALTVERKIRSLNSVWDEAVDDMIVDALLEHCANESQIRALIDVCFSIFSFLFCGDKIVFILLLLCVGKFGMIVSLIFHSTCTEYLKLSKSYRYETELSHATQYSMHNLETCCAASA